MPEECCPLASLAMHTHACIHTHMHGHTHTHTHTHTHETHKHGFLCSHKRAVMHVPLVLPSSYWLPHFSILWYSPHKTHMMFSSEISTFPLDFWDIPLKLFSVFDFWTLTAKQMPPFLMTSSYRLYILPVINSSSFCLSFRCLSCEFDSHCLSLSHWSQTFPCCSYPVCWGFQLRPAVCPVSALACWTVSPHWSVSPHCAISTATIYIVRSLW